MFRFTRIVLTISILLLSQSSSLAQGSTPNVTATAGNHHVRYISIGEVQQTRLQIFAPNGAQIFDSEFKLGNLVDWPLQDQQGARVPDGVYLFVVTVKDFLAKLSQRYGTTQVDQENVYVERTDRNDLPASQAAALDASRQGEGLSLVDRIGAIGISSNVSVNQTNSGERSKSTSATDTAASVAPTVAGTGSTGQLTKWIDGANGTLGDSVITESGNNIGIGTTAPGFLLDARTSSPANATVAISSTLGVPPDNVGFLAGVDAANRGRYDFSWRSGAGGLALRNGSNTAGNILFFTNSSGTNGLGNETEKVRIDKSGNIGVGTSSPAYTLDVRGIVGVTDSSANTAARLRSLGSGGRGALEMFDGSVLKTAFYSDANDSFINGGGNFGIGTTNPSYKLDVRNGIIAVTDSSARLAVTLRSVGPGGRGALEMYDGSVLKTGIYSDANNSFINGGGNFGIGTTNPQSKLDVAGDINVTGNANITGNIAAKYQDVAEWVPSREEIGAGTVVVLDATHGESVTLSRRAYDTLVAGVVSAQPGLILGERGAGKVMVATTGRVRVKVDASRYRIRIGDLLVTSDKPGMAMRSLPLRAGGKLIHRPGTIIGKALQPWVRGQGEIMVLLSLQ
jgi:hypothetical protein